MLTYLLEEVHKNCLWAKLRRTFMWQKFHLLLVLVVFIRKWLSVTSPFPLYVHVRSGERTEWRPEGMCSTSRTPKPQVQRDGKEFLRGPSDNVTQCLENGHHSFVPSPNTQYLQSEDCCCKQMCLLRLEKPVSLIQRQTTDSASSLAWLW